MARLRPTARLRTLIRFPLELLARRVSRDDLFERPGERPPSTPVPEPGRPVDTSAGTSQDSPGPDRA